MSDNKDPLSLLAGDSSSSESEVEEEETHGRKKSLTDKSYYTPSELVKNITLSSIIIRGSSSSLLNLYHPF